MGGSVLVALSDSRDCFAGPRALYAPLIKPEEAVRFREEARCLTRLEGGSVAMRARPRYCKADSRSFAGYKSNF